MLVYWLGGGVNDLISVAQWSVNSHHCNLAVYSYIHILSIDAHTHTHTHTQMQMHNQTRSPTQACMHTCKSVCTNLHAHTAV